jgi:hypothetical protein
VSEFNNIVVKFITAFHKISHVLEICVPFLVKFSDHVNDLKTGQKVRFEIREQKIVE